jgi:hypothetical protein
MRAAGPRVVFRGTCEPEGPRFLTDNTAEILEERRIKCKPVIHGIGEARGASKKTNNAAEMR